MRRCMWTSNIKNEVVMARVGPQRHKKKKKRDNVEKYFRAGQATDENMAHAHCMLHA